MREWNSYSDDITIDGNEVKEYTIRFKTTEYEVYKRIEKFFQRLIDESNCSEIPNNCEVKNYCDDCLYTDVCDSKEFFYACTSKATISKMEQVDKDTNVRSKEPQIIASPIIENDARLYEDEPQTDEEYINNLPWTEAGNGEQKDIEIARAIVHKAIDDAVIAEDAYPDLRQKMHDAVDNYEPQTDCAWKKGE